MSRSPPSARCLPPIRLKQRASCCAWCVAAAGLVWPIGRLKALLGRLFKLIACYAPPPAGLKSPVLWGFEPRLKELFGAEASAIHCARRNFNFRYRSAAHWIEVFRNYYGPTHKVFAALDAARQADLTADLTTLLEEFNLGGLHSLVVPANILKS
jgi:hypothetical protein